MPVIVVTRLRLRDPAFFDEFFASAVAAVEQAQATEGNLSADVLAEANNTYWTRTAWQGRAAMDSFVGTEPHLSTMNRIDEWCDEATFVDWEQQGADLPDWQNGYRRLVADGQGASLTHGTAAHTVRDFPAPVVS
jgi:quinol monooxygenase YgiN